MLGRLERILSGLFLGAHASSVLTVSRLTEHARCVRSQEASRRSAVRSVLVAALCLFVFVCDFIHTFRYSFGSGFSECCPPARDTEGTEISQRRQGSPCTSAHSVSPWCIKCLNPSRAWLPLPRRKINFDLRSLVVVNSRRSRGACLKAASEKGSGCDSRTDAPL